MIRAAASDAPPGGKVTISFTGRAGQVCAGTVPAPNTDSTAAAAVPKAILRLTPDTIIHPPDCSCQSARYAIGVPPVRLHPEKVRSPRASS